MQTQQFNGTLEMFENPKNKVEQAVQNLEEAADNITNEWEKEVIEAAAAYIQNEVEY